MGSTVLIRSVFYGIFCTHSAHMRHSSIILIKGPQYISTCIKKIDADETKCMVYKLSPRGSSRGIDGASLLS